MAILPDNPWVTRDFDTILAEMLTLVPSTMDKSVGSFIYDSLSPVAAAMADAFLKADVLRLAAFIDTANGAYLDAHVERHGLLRKAAVQAIGVIRFNATQGVVVPPGTQVSTLSDPNSSTAAVVFSTDAIATIQPRGGTGTHQETHASITYTGIWNVDATTKFSVVVNDTAKIFFNGTAITVRLITGPSKGKVGWKIDGGAETIVDLYAVGVGTQDIVISGLSAANHDLLLRVETKNVASSANTVNVDYYTIVGGALVITDTKDIPITALTGGTLGNVGSGTITRLVSSINGVVSVTNPTATAGGSQEEQDEELRTRFKIYVSNPPASGNSSDYKKWATDSSVLVGNADVQPLWNGAGTVKVFVVDKSNNPADAAIITVVQEYIDPLASPGLGKGKAPIGATVTVVAPTTVPIDVRVTLTIKTGYNVATVQANVTEAIRTYIRSLTIADTIRFAGIANAVHDTSGVSDYSALQFRRDAAAYAAANIVMAAGEKAVLDLMEYV